ncbi:hypothetical protein CM49_01457 [Paenibacillus sp. P1XP2]|nr:hypothetical protein CM49_01457 [Paenibacillus sp. P1XP2]
MKVADHSWLIQQAERFVKQVHAGEASGHDWWHIDRVRNTALDIAAKENADRTVCELAALLHDVADEKLNASKEAGLEKVRAWLTEQAADEDLTGKVMDIIANMSYNGGKNPPMTTLEAGRAGCGPSGCDRGDRHRQNVCVFGGQRPHHP